MYFRILVNFNNGAPFFRTSKLRTVPIMQNALACLKVPDDLACTITVLQVPPQAIYPDLADALGITAQAKPTVLTVAEANAL